MPFEVRKKKKAKKSANSWTWHLAIVGGGRINLDRTRYSSLASDVIVVIVTSDMGGR